VSQLWSSGVRWAASGSLGRGHEGMLPVRDLVILAGQRPGTSDLADGEVVVRGEVLPGGGRVIDREDDGSVVGEDAVKFSEDRCPVGYVVQDEGRDDQVLTRVRDEGEGLGKVGNENVGVARGAGGRGGPSRG
jgi:hypothetical protein